MVQGPRKLLAIGLDAAEWTLVKRWADEGHLPTFAALMEDGATVPLATTCDPFPDTVWSCLYSGRNPAHFEKYFYVGYDPATGGLRHVRDDGFTDRPFWRLLSDAGKRVGVADAVKIPVSRDLNGYHVANWGAHATKTPPASWPPALLGEVRREVGTHPVGDIDAMDDTLASYCRKRADLLEGVRKHGELNRWLMRTREWDVHYASFSEPHQVGHFFWHWMDETHPRHRAESADGLDSTMRDVYAAVDREIASLVEAAGPDATTLVFAGHGMGPLRHATWNLGEMLDLWGFGPRPARAADTERARVNPWRTLKRVLPGRLQYGIKNRLPEAMQDWLLFKWYAGRFDPRGRRAFAVPSNDAVGLIRVNVRGQDRFGEVDPSDVPRVVDEVKAALEELTDPVTGRRVVANASKIHELYDGPFRDAKPHLSVMWDSSFPWRSIHSPRFGTLALEDQDSRSGSHTPIGFLLARGPGIPSGVERPKRHVFDVCPTILALAGVRPPDDLDGSAIDLVEATVPTG